MKKNILFIPICCLALAGCGGGTDRSEQDNTAVEGTVLDETNGLMVSTDIALDDLTNPYNITEQLRAYLDAEYNIDTEETMSGSISTIVFDGGERMFDIRSDSDTGIVYVCDGRPGGYYAKEAICKLYLDQYSDSKSVISDIAGALLSELYPDQYTSEFVNDDSRPLECMELAYVLEDTWKRHGYVPDDSKIEFAMDASKSLVGYPCIKEDGDYSTYVAFEMQYNDDEQCYFITAEDYDHAVGTFYGYDYLSDEDMALDMLNKMSDYYNTVKGASIQIAAEVAKNTDTRTIRSTADICCLMVDYLSETGETEPYISYIMSLSGPYREFEPKGSVSIAVGDNSFYALFNPQDDGIAFHVVDYLEGYKQCVKVYEKDFTSREALAEYILDQLQNYSA